MREKLATPSKILVVTAKFSLGKYFIYAVLTNEISLQRNLHSIVTTQILWYDKARALSQIFSSAQPCLLPIKT